MTHIEFLQRLKLAITRLILFSLSILSTSLYALPVITLATTDNVGSYFHTPQYQGLADEILSEAFTRINYTLEIVVLPTERSLKMASSGQLDGELLRTTAIERMYPKLIRVPEPVIDIDLVVFSYAPIDTRTGWASLKGKSVGLVNGMKAIEQSIPIEAHTTGVKNINQLLNMLLNKRIEFAIYPYSLAEEFIRENNIPDILFSEPPLISIPTYVYLNDKHTHLAPKLKNALQEMKQDGTFQKIKKKHKRTRKNNQTLE